MKKLITLIILCMIAAVPYSAFAASLDLRAETDSGIAAGDSFTLTVSYSSDYLDSVKAEVRYDTGQLEYISGGSSTGDGGVVSLKGNSDDGRALTFKLKFKALKQGAASLAVTTEEAYDLDGKAMNTPYVTRNINIGTAAADNKEDSSSDSVDSSSNIDNSSTDSDSSTDTASDMPDQREQNSRLLAIAAAVTAAVLAAVCIIAAANKKKRNRDK